MRTALGFVGGLIVAALVGAAAMRFGTPLDASFTYQGQLRNAGQLVNGPADLRFTLWDSATGGTKVGNSNSVSNYQLVDGRFSTDLNFGAGAFNGDQRWVQIEFRIPAGTGQYLALTPRDKIAATPYALYALNSVESQWSYNPKSQAVTTDAQRVGIGISTPTARFEVGGAGGDDSVKLPHGSVGADELVAGIPSSAAAWAGFAQIGGGGSYHNGGSLTPVSRTISVPNPSVLQLNGVVWGVYTTGATVRINGAPIYTTPALNSQFTTINTTVALPAGTHTVQIGSGPYEASAFHLRQWVEVTATLVPRSLESW